MLSILDASLWMGSPKKEKILSFRFLGVSAKTFSPWTAATTWTARWKRDQPKADDTSKCETLKRCNFGSNSFIFLQNEFTMFLFKQKSHSKFIQSSICLKMIFKGKTHGASRGQVDHLWGGRCSRPPPISFIPPTVSVDLVEKKETRKKSQFTPPTTCISHESLEQKNKNKINKKFVSFKSQKEWDSNEFRIIHSFTKMKHLPITKELRVRFGWGHPLRCQASSSGNRRIFFFSFKRKQNIFFFWKNMQILQRFKATSQTAETCGVDDERKSIDFTVRTVQGGIRARIYANSVPSDN